MALDVGFENEWWNAPSNDNVRDEIVAKGSEEKHDDVRLIGDVDSEKSMLPEVGVSKNDGISSKKNKKKKNAKGKGKGIDAGNDQGDTKEKGKTLPTKSSNKWRDLTLRVVIEKERRSNEARLFDELRDLNPDLPQTAFKTTIVIGAIKQIKSLEETLHRLQIQKERLLQHAAAAANSNSAPIINVSSSHATRVPINNNKGPLSFKTWTSPNVTLSVCGNDAVINICCVKKPGLNSAISFVLMKHNLEPQSFHVSTVGAKTMLMIRFRGDVAPEFADGFSWEEKYKKVAAEIMVCVSA